MNKLICMVAALILTVVLIMAEAPTPTFAQTTPGRIIINPSFEQPDIPGTNGEFDESLVPGWQTTATDNLIEIWTSGFLGVPAQSGNQLAELQATQPSILFQELCLVTGETFNWSLYHRGRDGVETMQLTIGGVVQGQFTTGTGAWQNYSGSYTHAGATGSALFEFGSIFPPTGGASAETVDVTVTGGDATVGTDFTNVVQVSVPAGDYDGTAATAIAINLTILDETAVESDETIDFALANATGSLQINDSDCNGSAQTTATYTIINDDVNSSPVASNDAYTTNEDTPLNVAAPGVLSNDTDADSNPLTAVKDSDPSSGSLTFNSDGSFDYSPNANFCGQDSFTYHANDGTDDSNIATVTIDVVCVNDTPAATDDSYNTNEDTPLNIAAPGVLSNDTDADGDPLTAVKDSDPSHGTLTLNSDGSFDYTPNTNFCGQDSFTYHANDGTANSNVATVTIDVVCINDAPMAVDDAYSTNEDTVLNVPAPGVLGNDSDQVEGDPLTAIEVSGPSNGTLMLNANGSFTYTPNAGFFGVDSFTYKANDGTDDSNIATVTITIFEVIATCGGFDVIKTGPGQISAPNFSGTLIVGTPYYDWIIGTHGPDLILGLGGPDDIYGKGGDDVICGGKGVDIIEGQGGNDILYGDQHDDWLIGGYGNDTLYGGKGWDDLEGNGGQDTLYGEEGYDVLLGGSQSDWLFGGDGPDDLYGQRGSDDLDGGNGNDFCKGGPGSDTITDCEGASSAAVGKANADDVAMETAGIDAARTRNDGESGEHTIVQRIKDLFLPLITR